MPRRDTRPALSRAAPFQAVLVIIAITRLVAISVTSAGCTTNTVEGRSSTRARKPTSCVAAERAGLSAQTPAEFAVEQLRNHRVLALGEMHNLAPQIQFIADVVATAADRGLDFDLGMELLPSYRQPDLDRLVRSPSFDDALYYNIIGDAYILGPLQYDNYRDVVRAVWSQNQIRSHPIRIVGLLPDCRLASTGGREQSLACEDSRDEKMAELARDQTLSAGRALILYTGNRHAAVQVRRPTGEPFHNVTTFLDEQVRGQVFSILLGGPDATSKTDVDEWRSPCGGLFDLLFDELGAVPFAIDLRRAPFDRLGIRCTWLGNYSDANSALSDAYQGYVHLMRPEDMPSVRAIPRAAYDAFSADALPGINRYLVEVLSRPPAFAQFDAERWHSIARREAAAWGRFRRAPPDWCTHRSAYLVPASGSQ